MIQRDIAIHYRQSLQVITYMGVSYVSSYNLLDKKREREKKQTNDERCTRIDIGFVVFE